MPDFKRSRSRSRSRNRNRGMLTRFTGRTRRGPPPECGGYSTQVRASYAGLDRGLIRRPASGARASPFYAQTAPLAPNVSGNAMIANWVIGKDCDLFDFANAIKDSIFDLTVVTVTKEVTSRHDIFKHLENLHRGTAAPWKQNVSNVYATIEHTLRKQARWRTARSALR